MPVGDLVPSGYSAIKPPFWSTLAAAVNAFDAREVPRSTGICPALLKKVRIANPLRPLPSKYSDLAKKVTRREVANGTTMESIKDRWFGAKIAAPVLGIFSAPSIQGV